MKCFIKLYNFIWPKVCLESCNNFILKKMIYKCKNLKFFIVKIFIEEFKKLKKYFYFIYKELYNDFFLWKYINSDILSFYNRDPSSNSISNIILHIKGYKIMHLYRLSIFLYKKNLKILSFIVKNLINDKYNVDISLKTYIGEGVLLDHGNGIIIGDQVHLGNNVTILHDVTLGNNGKKSFRKRHPIIMAGVYIGTNTKILGKLKIEHCTCIAANSIILRNILSNNIAIGAPSKLIV